MGYKMPIVCKDVILPISLEDAGLTLEEYKNKYGIDLKEFIVLNPINKCIEFKDGNYKLLIRNIADDSGVRLPVFIPSLKSVNYISESHNAELFLCDLTSIITANSEEVASYNTIMVFVIGKEDEFKLENLKIYHGDNY